LFAVNHSRWLFASSSRRNSIAAGGKPLNSADFAVAGGFDAAVFDAGFDAVGFDAGFDAVVFDAGFDAVGFDAVVFDAVVFDVVGFLAFGALFELFGT
jgi:hypothetical protein